MIDGSDVIAEARRWSSAIERSVFGVWDYDPTVEEVHYSPGWKARLGFPRVTEADPAAFWRCRVHPDDLAPMLRSLRLHLDGSSPAYETRFRLRSNGAGYRPMLSRGRVVARDGQGAPMRMVGTMIDLNGRLPVRAKHGLVAEDPPIAAAGPVGRIPLHALLASGGGQAGGRMADLVGDLLDLALRDAAATP